MAHTVQFIDKKGRTITICLEDDVCALYDGKEIGTIGIDHPDGGPILWSMNVQSEYQRSGIATEIMKHVADMYGKGIGKPIFSAVGGKNANTEDYYTQDGAAFIQHCIERGILKDTDYLEDKGYPDYFETE